MIEKFRLIPALTLSNEDLIKTIKYRNKAYLGDPINTIKILTDFNVPEIALIDIESSNKKQINFEFLSEIASEAFVPLTYGGGIQSLKDCDKLFKSGFEKIIIGSKSFDYNFVESVVDKYGASSVSICVDIKKDIFNNPKIYAESGKIKKNVRIADHIKKIEETGVGEIIISEFSRDGLRLGIDKELIGAIRQYVSCNMIAKSGLSSYNECKELEALGLNGVISSSLITFSSLDTESIIINFKEEYSIQYRQYNLNV